MEHPPLVFEYEKIATNVSEDLVTEQNMSHTDERPYQCTVCDQAVTQSSDVKYHYHLHTGMETAKYTVEGYPGVKYLTEHQHSDTDTESSQVAKCDKKPINSGTLKKLKFRPTADTASRCSVCNNQVTSSNELGRHQCILQGNLGKKPYTCTTCGKIISNHKTIKRHLRTHSGEKPYKCTVCGKELTSAYGLTLHRRTHSDYKQLYKCSLCDKMLNNSKNLKRHSLLHTGEKPYKCTVCGKGFNQPYDLTIHQRIHTGEKPYKCTVCGRQFSQSNALTIHHRSHSGDKPYLCAECGRGFTTSSALANHQLIHSEERPFLCTVCGKHFTQPQGLIKHHRTHKLSRTVNTD